MSNTSVTGTTGVLCAQVFIEKKAKVQPVHGFQKKLAATVTSMSILVTVFYGDCSAGI